MIHIFPSIQRANGLMRWTHCAISSCALLRLRRCLRGLPSLRSLKYTPDSGSYADGKSGRTLQPPLNTCRPEDVHRVQISSAEDRKLTDPGLERDLESLASTGGCFRALCCTPRPVSTSTTLEASPRESAKNAGLPRPDSGTSTARVSGETGSRKVSVSTKFRRSPPRIPSPPWKLSHKAGVPEDKSSHELLESRSLPKRPLRPYQLASSVKDRFL